MVFFYEHHQHQSKLYNQKCATKKCTSLVCKKLQNRAGGRLHISVDTQFCRKWLPPNLCNKKCPKASLYFLFFFRAGDFSKKNGDNIFLLWGEGREGFALKKGSTIYPYTVFNARRITCKSSWKPKRTQTATKWWPFGFVLVFNSAYGNGRHWL